MIVVLLAIAIVILVEGTIVLEATSIRITIIGDYNLRMNYNERSLVKNITTRMLKSVYE